jgi:hypothetical protein
MIECKSAQWEPRCYLTIDGRTVWYNFNSRGLFCRLMSPAIKRIRLHIRCRIILSDFNQIWIFTTDFYINSQYQGSHKSVQWQARRYMLSDGQTDRNNESNRCFWRLWECSQNNTISSLVIRVQHHKSLRLQNEWEWSGQDIKLPQDRYKMKAQKPQGDISRGRTKRK